MLEFQTKDAISPGDGPLQITYIRGENHDLNIGVNVQNRFTWLNTERQVSFQIIKYGKEELCGLVIFEAQDDALIYTLTECGSTLRIRCNKLFNDLLRDIDGGIYEVVPVRFYESDQPEKEYPAILFGKQ